ncbi:hypothetical protein [Nocardia sp. NPDC060259]|uniref:hypothetical protein n=1 Tax=Nocardia sp. NPDC060259 TaxID=3347088 RepID=UPI00365925D1
MEVERGKALRHVLAEISGHPIGDHDYVAFFVNEHGEQMVFVREPLAEHGFFLHSDLDWEPKLVARPPTSGGSALDVPPETRHFLGDVPVVGDVILDRSESLWLSACLAASADW